ncbi:MAG: nucleoside hydrolase [Bacteroidia bacterium]|nr:nucleoside hydrolase [Bacteroidia bacterium]
MKYLANTVIVLALVLTGCGNPGERVNEMPVKIIFDTDLGSDYDDVGALAFLHAMADSGKTEILGTMASNRYELTAPSIDVLNTYFGRTDLPVGSPKTGGVTDISPYHWADTLVALYPHKIRTTNDAPDAVRLYRKLLAEQEDTSVIVVTVGYLTNLSNLLKSQPDDIAPLAGKELILRKVKKLVTMGGIFPAGGRSFNIFMDSVASEYVFKNWPGEIIFTGDDIGEKIKTGLRLINSGIKNSPVKDTYRIGMPLSGDTSGRMSWDQTAVLIGVYGTDGYFDTVRGKITVNPDGSNTWKDNPAGNHFYVKQKMPVDEMTKFIEDRMMHAPMNR